MSNLQLSIVIPAYNEAERITPTVRDVHAWVSATGVTAEILVVDDGSTDETAVIVRALAGELPGVRLLQSAANRGKGAAVRLGMRRATGALRLFMDADNSVAIRELPGLLRRVADGADVAIGSRRAPGAARDVRPPWYRRAWSRVANGIVQAGLLGGIADTQCGFKLFTAAAATHVFARLETEGWGFDLEVLVLARRAGLRIDEVAVAWSDDPRSKVDPWRDAWRISREFLRIRRRFRTAAKKPAETTQPARRIADTSM
jgi:dolichyl-phosphate beta-glucosyltransferase